MWALSFIQLRGWQADPLWRGKRRSPGPSWPRCLTWMLIMVDHCRSLGCRSQLIYKCSNRWQLLKYGSWHFSWMTPQPGGINKKINPGLTAQVKQHGETPNSRPNPLPGLEVELLRSSQQNLQAMIPQIPGYFDARMTSTGHPLCTSTLHQGWVETTGGAGALLKLQWARLYLQKSY